MEKREELLKQIEELKEEMNSDQKDFINHYMTNWVREYDKETDTMQFRGSLTSVNFLDDAMREYADGEVSVYYGDQIDYYHEHTSECMDAFKEYAYQLKDFEDLEDAVAKAGACGWFNEVYYALNEGNKLEELNDLIEELEDLENEE